MCRVVSGGGKASKKTWSSFVPPIQFFKSPIQGQEKEERKKSFFSTLQAYAQQHTTTAVAK